MTRRSMTHPQDVAGTCAVGGVHDRARIGSRLRVAIGTAATLGLMLVVLTPQRASAVPAYPGIIALTQPDGTKIRARLKGDEWYHWTEDLQGRTLVKNARGFWVPGPRPARSAAAAARRAQAQARVVPPTGIGNVPVVLANFADTTPTYTAADFSNALFGSGSGTMRSFYSEVSYGDFTVSAGPGGVVGWYTAANNHDYYGESSSSGDARDLVREMVIAADADGFNFAPYDQDGNGVVDVFCVVHQGPGAESTGDLTNIWSHRWAITPYLTNDGVYVVDYIIQPETLFGQLSTVGVFCHEYGHALGLPDLYDTDYSSDGLGAWSLMAAGSWNGVSLPGDCPAHLDAWCKVELGWVTPILQTTTVLGAPIARVETNRRIYKLWAKNASTPNEYFLVENRQQIGFDAALPGPGLCVYHVDDSVYGNDNEWYPGHTSSGHYQVALEQADGNFDLEQAWGSDAGDPYPGTSNKRSIDASTVPDNRPYDGSAPAFRVANISNSASTMTADFIFSGGPPPPGGAPTMLDEPLFTPGLTNTVSWGAVTGATRYYVEWSTSASFSGLAGNSGWITPTSYTATGLADGTTYFYRVKARVGLMETGWSNVVSSTQDNTAPSSSVNPIASPQSTMQFVVSWTSTDATSGVKFTRLFYRHNGGSYQQFGGDLTGTSTLFTCPNGNGTYDFYTRATDNVDNEEAAPAAPDRTVVVSAPPNAPVMNPEPTFTQGTTNGLSWGSVPSAVDYWVEASEQPEFASVVWNSGWVAGTSTTATGLTDGQIYYYRARARNAQGQSPWSNVVSSTQDDTPPSSSVNPLPPQASTSFTVTWAVSDATSGVQYTRLYYRYGGVGPYTQFGGDFTGTSTTFTSPSGPGWYELYTCATDNVGNTEAPPGTPDLTVLVGQAPLAPTMNPEPPFTPGVSNLVSWTSVPGATEYYMEWDTVPSFATPDGNSAWTTSTSFLAQVLAGSQIYYYHVKCRNAYGESPWSNVVSSTQDNVPPTSSVDPLNPVQTNLTFPVSWTASDGSGSGVALVRLYYRFNGTGPYVLFDTVAWPTNSTNFTSPAGAGTYDLYTRATDNVGNVEAAPPVPDQTVVVGLPPAAPVLDPEPPFTPGSTNTLSWNAVTGATLYWLEWSHGNAPFIPVNHSGWIPDTSHVASPLADGQIYYYRVKAHNANGDSGWSNVVSSTQDATPPTSAVTAPTTPQPTTSFPVTWTATDATSGVAFTRLYYTYNGGPPTQFGGDFTGTGTTFTSPEGMGTYGLYTRATDNAGNEEAAPGAPDQTIVVGTAPGAPVMNPEPPFTAGTSNTVSWGAVADATEYYVEWATTNSPFTPVGNSGWIVPTSFNVTSLTDGQLYFYRVRARNGVGPGPWSNVVSSTQDATPPASAVDPIASPQATPSFPVTWTATDATSGVAFTRLYYSHNGGPWTQFGGDFAGAGTTFTSPAGPGTYELYTRATDVAGNVEAPPLTADQTVVVQPPAPAAPVLNPEPPFTAGTTNTISWQAVPGATEYWLEWSPSSTPFVAAGNSGWVAATNATATGLPDGSLWFYRAKARNAGGESGWSNVVSSTQDATAPASSVNPLQSPQENLTFPVTWTATDATSGVAFTRLYYSFNGGPWTQFGGDYTGVGTLFTSPNGRGVYALYTRATDNVGNEEAAPSTPDVQVDVGVGNILTWNPVTRNLKLGPQDVANTGWYDLANPAGAQVLITVTRTTTSIRGVFSQYDANGGAHGDAVPVTVPNYLHFTWQLRAGFLWRLTQQGFINGVTSTAVYYASTHKTIVNGVWKDQAWELTHTFVSPTQINPGDQFFVP